MLPGASDSRLIVCLACCTAAGQTSSRALAPGQLLSTSSLVPVSPSRLTVEACKKVVHHKAKQKQHSTQSNRQKTSRKPLVNLTSLQTDTFRQARNAGVYRPPPRHMTDWRMSSATDMEEKHAALVSCCWTASSSAFCSAVRKSCSGAEGIHQLKNEVGIISRQLTAGDMSTSCCALSFPLTKSWRSEGVLADRRCWYSERMCGVYAASAPSFALSFSALSHVAFSTARARSARTAEAVEENEMLRG